MTGPSPPAACSSRCAGCSTPAVEILQVRLELFGSELEQEKLRLSTPCCWPPSACCWLVLALVLAIAFVVLLFQEGYRLPAVGVLTLLFGGGGWWLLRRAREELRAGDGGPFAMTLGELRRDRDGLGAGEAPRRGV